MTFQLDTSGYVEPSLSANPPLLFDFRWDDLNPFTQGYVEALFAAHSISRYRSDEDRTYSHGAFDMLAPETLARIIADCEAQLETVGWVNITTSGYDFWHQRQRGFAGPAFPPLTVSLGDDGKVRVA